MQFPPPGECMQFPRQRERERERERGGGGGKERERGRERDALGQTTMRETLTERQN